MIIGLAPGTASTDSLDVVGDVNQRTQGTEFYGTSSNFVLLNQLFAFAREHNPSRYVGSNGNGTTPYLFPASTSSGEVFVTPGTDSLVSGDQDARSSLAGLSQDRISIINLLSNEEVLSPPSRPKTPPHSLQVELGGARSVTNKSSRSTPRDSSMVDRQTTRNGEITNDTSSSRTSTGQSNQTSAAVPAQDLKTKLGKVYFNMFLNNLHHLLPILDPVRFKERCERDVWGTYCTSGRQKGFRDFFALYNIVVAVGALTAGSHVFNELGLDLQLCIAQLAEAENNERVNTSQAISRIYFRRSKDLLGDTTAVCSLESAQTLLLMVTTHNSVPGYVR